MRPSRGMFPPKREPTPTRRLLSKAHRQQTRPQLALPVHLAGLVATTTAAQAIQRLARDLLAEQPSRQHPLQLRINSPEWLVRNEENDEKCAAGRSSKFLTSAHQQRLQ
jgi:hypothetical protein